MGAYSYFAIVFDIFSTLLSVRRGTGSFHYCSSSIIANSNYCLQYRSFTAQRISSFISSLFYFHTIVYDILNLIVFKAYSVYLELLYNHISYIRLNNQTF